MAAARDSSILSHQSVDALEMRTWTRERYGQDIARLNY